MQDNFVGNVCLAAPGLAITVGTSATIKYANTFRFKANGRISPSITTAATPSLLTAVLNGPFVNGSTTAVPTKTTLATGYTRTYTLVGTLPINGTATVTPTYSWLVSPDTVNSDVPTISGANTQLNNNQTAIGYVNVINVSGSDFTPATTALDAANVTVTYVDNYGIGGSL